MPRFGFSLAALLALAVPAWASYPPPVVADGYPTPMGYPIAASAPEMLPPVGFAPGGMMGGAPGAGWYAPPGGALPPGCDPCAPGAQSDPCSFALDPCGPERRTRRARCHHEGWIRGDWLYYHFRDMPLPVLVSTGNPSIDGAGVPGSGNFVPLVGGPRDIGRFHGVRLTIGQWFDQDGELGGEISGFIFGREGTASFFPGTAARPIVSVPVTGVDGVPTAFDFAFPGMFTGVYGVRTASQFFGGEGNLLHRWYGDGCISFDSLFGYRYLNLNERLDLLGRSQATGGMSTFNGAILPRGVTVFTNDAFRARTEFHGAQIGGRIEARRDMFTFTVFGKGGAGVNLQTLRVEGNTQATGFGITRTALGGVRALRTNFGRDTNTDFSLIGETGVELGLQLTKQLSLRVGYNLLFWSDVLRPANVIDPVTNFTQVPIDPTFSNPFTGPARPATVFRSTDFLAHGLVVGAQFDY